MAEEDQERNLDNQHPDYVATATARDKSRDLYDGSRAVKAADETYLYKEPRELDDDYDLRLKRAVLDPYLPKIIRARLGVLFRKKPKRELPDKINVFIEDVDRNGTSADVFFEEAAQDAQIDGIHWVLIDMPKALKNAPNSAADEQQGGLRPFFQHVPANQVIDWEVGLDGNLLWVVIKQSRTLERLEPGIESESINQWKLWFRDKWETWEENEDGDTTMVDTADHELQLVPLVPFFGVKETEQSGLPVAATILDHLILMYNKASDLDRSERITAHPILYQIGPTKLELLNLIHGVYIDSSDAGDSPVEIGLLETSGNAFASIQESLARLLQTILSTVLAQAKRDSAQVQSAEAQKEDRKFFNASLKAASLRYQSAELQCWMIWAKWISVTGEISVEYNQDFDDNVIDEAMISRLMELAGSQPVITQKTLLGILQKGEIIDPKLDVDKELLDIKKADSEAAAELAKSLIPAAQNMPPEADE